MKYLSKLLSMLLVGAMLYSTGCTDYKNDIDNLNQKVDEIQKELQEGQIDPLKADLAQTKEDLASAQEAIEALTTKHNEDIDALKAVDSQLDGKIKEANDAILALEGALEQEVEALEAEIAALETALAQAKKDAEDADAALKAELVQKITDLETELLAKVAELQEKLEGDIEDLRADMQAKIDAANEAIDEAIEDIDALDLRVDDLEQTDEDLQAAIDALEEEIATTNAELAVLRAELEQEKADRINGDAAEKAAREAAVKALEEAIAALEAKHDAEVALLQDAIDALNKKVDEELNLLKHRDAEYEKLLAAAQAGIESLGKQVEANYNELKGDVASLKAELQAEIEANKTAIAQNRFDIDRTIAAVETLNGNVAALQTSLQSTNQTLFALMSDYYSFKSEIVGRVASLEANVEKLDALYAEITEEIIPAIENQIAQNTALVEQTVADVQANAAALEEYKKAAAQTFSLLEQADAALWTAIAAANQTIYENKAEIANLRNELIESLAGVRAEIAASFADVYAKFDEIALAQARQYEEMLAAIEAVNNLTAVNAAAINDEVAAREAADKAISDEFKAFQFAYNSKVAELHKLIDTLEANHAALVAAFEAYKKEVEQKIADAIKTAVEKATGYTDMKINELQNYVNIENTKLSQKLDDAIAALDAAYKAADEVIRKEMVDADDKLQEQINIIVDRVQSLVFVPQYTDGKGTINYAKAGMTIVETRSEAEYQVYPAECADAIVSAFDAEKPSLTFDSEYLETRSGLSFDVVAVKKGSKPGRIVVTFEPRGLDEKFYTGETNKEYALSLVLTTDKVNLSSDYTNFVRAKNADEITMAFMLGEKAISGQYGQTITFEYTDTDTVEKVLPEHYVAFTVAGNTYNGIEALNAAGYALTMERSNYIDRYQDNLGTRPFVVNENEEGILEVKVDEVNGTLIGNYVDFGYTYVAGTLKAEAFSRYATSLVKSDVKFDGVTATWTYAQDAVVDAANDGSYSREFELALVEHDLPSDVDLEMVFANAADSVKVMLDGEEAEVDAKFFVKDGKVYLTFANFEWNKSYEVVATYTVLDKVLNDPCAEATVTVNVVTVDRSREVIKVQLTDSKWELTKRFVNMSRTDKESLMKIYDDAKSYLGEMTAEDFLKDIFVNHEFEYKNSANGESKESDDTYTKLVIVDEGTMIQSVYNVDEYKEIPEVIEYFYHITTWYGQEIEITKSLTLGLEPVEITLDAEPVEIEKNLQFTIDNQSLAEIFNQVNGVSVKMDDFTADEYLKAIFSDFELRAKSYTANGIEARGTSLTVDPAKPTYAVTAYDYADFNEAVMSVVYKTTYTTWYGQEIIINQVVDFEFPAYDFKHNTLYVYGADMDFYSQVQPEYTWKNDNEAEGLLKFDVAAVDLRAAFNVVDAAANKFTPEQIADLGLVYNFVIEDAIHDGISIDPATDKLSYYGANPYVNVRGNLYIVNDNNTRYTVPTSFDEGGKYASYNVVKFNPIGTAEVIMNPTIDVNNAIAYNVHVLDYVKLMDHRMGGRQNYDLITDGAWVTGNGENGFAQGVDVRANYIYRINEVWVDDTSDVDADIRPYVTLNNGTLTFDNTQQLELTAPFTVPVTLKFQNCWMEKPQQVTVKVTFNPIK